MRQVRRAAILVVVALASAATFAYAQPSAPRIKPAKGAGDAPKIPAADPESATKFAGLGDAEAWKLARGLLPADFALPLGSDPQATGTASTVARSAASSAPGTSAVPAADAKVTYLSDHSALVQAAGKPAPSLVASTFPLRTRDAAGRVSPLDLRLRQSGQYLIPRNAGTGVKLARNLQRSSVLSAVGLKVRAVGAFARSATARQASTAFYANAAKSTDVSLSAEPGGLQAMWVLRAASSPQDLSLALGASSIRLSKRPNSEVVVRGKGGKPIALVRAPVAWDARGVPVPVKTSVEGKNVRYRVAHRGRELQYPIVVDPIVETWNWSGVTTTPPGWTSTVATGHTATVSSGLRLNYTGGTRTTPGVAEWKYTAPTGAAITSFTPGAVAVTNSPTGSTCAWVGLRTSGGTVISPTPSAATCNITTLASSTYTSAVTNTANVAFFRHAPGTTAVTAGLTLPSATITLDDANVPAIGATTYSHPVNGWVKGQAMWAKPAVTDGGLGVKTTTLSRGGTAVDTKTQTCTGLAGATCPTSVTPQLDFDTSGLAEGIQHTFAISATDILNKPAATTPSFTVRVDKGIPDVNVSGSAIDAPITKDTPRELAIAATDGDPAEADPAKQKAGVKSIRVTVDDVPQNPDTVQGTCAHGCPLARTFTFNPASYQHGNHTIKATATDQAGNATTVAKRVAVDKAGPRIGLSGPLVDARGTTLTKESYRLDIVAIDGVHDAAPESGTQDIEVLWQDNATGAWTQLDYIWRACATDSCQLEHQYTFEPRRFSGAGRIAIKTHDKLENESFEYVDLTPSSTATFETTALSGLEEYLQFDSVSTGGGGRAHVNQTTGNLVWNLLPLVNAGRGLSTFANITYNSQTKVPDGTFTPYDEIGPNFSLGLSSITRVNEPLDITQADAATEPRITLVDPDGTRHVFRKHSSGLYYVPPAGFNVHLRRYSSAYDRTWAATRPDGATYFFDARGFPTYIEDRNTNVLKYTYEIVPIASGVSCPTWGVTTASFSATQCRQRLLSVTDSAGVRDGAPNRSVTLQYEAGNAGRIASITDQGGRVVRFTYSGGRLTSITQASGTPAERVHKLLYGPTGLGAVQDPRGAETQFTYTSGHKTRLAGQSPAVDELSDIRVSRVTQRDRRHRDYTYDKAPAESAVQWQSRASDARGETTTYHTDHRGRTFQIIDPRSTVTKLKWDGDNNVTEVLEAVDEPEAARTTMGYNTNGQLEWIASPEHDRTDLNYTASKGLFQAASGEGLDDFVTDLNEIESPKGDETGTPGDFAELFELDGRGNVTGRRDGEGNWSRSWFDQYGRVVKETDAMGNVTRYEQFHPSGQAGVMIDPKQGRWEYAYDAVGNLTATTDPRGAQFGGVSDPQHRFKARFEYDALDQLVGEILPKDSRAGDFITRRYDVDPNGNGKRSVDGAGAETTVVFDEMDRPTTVTTPPVAHAGETEAAPEISRFEYDGEGLVTREQRPRGDENQASSLDFSTDYEYDANGQLVVQREHQLEPGGGLTSLVTSMAYDRRGNLTGVVDPRTNAAASVGPVAAAQSDTYRRWRFGYDRSDRRTDSIEDPSGEDIRREYQYDANDNLVIERVRQFQGGQPRWDETYRRYDGRDMLVNETDPEGEERRYERRADGLVDRILHPRYFETGWQENEFAERFVYDANGDVVEHHLPRTDLTADPESGYTWKYQRDAVGDPRKVTDPRGNSFENAFLDAGVLRATTRPSAWKVENGALAEKSWQEMGNDAASPGLPDSEGDFGAVEGSGMPGLLPKAGRTEFGYDDELRLTTVTESLDAGTPADDVTSRLDRDALGRVVKVTRPRDTAAGKVISELTGYDRNGNVAVTTDGTGASTRREYDQFDRLVAQHAPQGSSGTPDVARYTYTPNDLVSSVESPRGPKSYSCYDRVDRLISSTDPTNGYSSYTYDDAGNVVSETAPRGYAADPTPTTCGDAAPGAASDVADHTTTRTYDKLNRVKTVQDGTTAGGQLYEYEYDADSNVTKVTAPGASTDPAGPVSGAVRRSTETLYDARGFAYRTTVKRGNVDRMTVTERDGNGNLRRVVNPNGVEASTRAPKFSAKTAPERTSIASTDDRENDVVKLATRDATLYEYSDDNLLTAVHLPTAVTEPNEPEDERYRQTFHLDQRGRTHYIDAPNEWTKAPTVCEAGKLDQSFNEPLKTACVQRTTLDYFDTGWIRRSIEPAGARKVNQDITVTGGEIHEYDYDARGLQTSWTVKNAKDELRRTSTRSYWPNGQLASRLADRAGNRKPEDKPREYDYRYTKNGQLASVIDRGMDISAGNPGDDRVFRLGYDDADRLIATDEDDLPGRPGMDTAMQLDPEGNVVERWHNGKLPSTVTVSGGKVTGSTNFPSFTGTRTSFTYDPWSRETKTIVRPQNTGDVRQQIDTAYWPSGEKRERVEKTFPTATPGTLTVRSTEKYGWTTDGRPNRTTRTPAAKDTTYGYDPNGFRTADETGGYKVNARGQMTQWQRLNGGPVVNYKVNGAGDVLRKEDKASPSVDVDYRYAVGRLAETVTAIGGTTPTTRIERLGYDLASNNVLSVNRIVNPNQGTNEQQQPLASFDYDPFDRVTQQTLHLNETTTPTGDDGFDREYFDYDAFDRRDKQRESQSRNGSPESMAASTVDFGYIGTTDALSRRAPLWKSDYMASTWDYDSNLEAIGQGRTTPTGDRTSYRTLAKDVNGTVEALLGTTGAAAATETYRYDPYGSAVDANQREHIDGLVNNDLESARSTEAKDNPIRFQGFYFDSGVRTYDMRARSYLPSAGRFLTQDRFEDSTGDFNLASDPLTQNRYAFAGGNPVSNVEFDGHRVCGPQDCKGASNKEKAKRNKRAAEAQGEAQQRSAAQQVAGPPAPEPASMSHQAQIDRLRAKEAEIRQWQQKKKAREEREKKEEGGILDGLEQSVGLVKGTLSHLEKSLNATDQDDYREASRQNWDMLKGAATDPVGTLNDMAQPLEDAYNQGGLDQAAGVMPGIVANAVGVRGVARGGRGSRGSGGSSASRSAAASEEGGLNLFKFNHPTSTRADGWRPGDRMLFLPNQGNVRANWKQNSTRLRQEMRAGRPIYDSHVDGSGNLLPTTGFLAMERNVLENRGWEYDPSRRAWKPGGR
ncbi:MAG TPA: RHS repeat-associated core domain-containing protein [Solirubrobacteraceae bacterium]|nr:RHS repeat-associated core domain-containing protein [Solirubrobacteraceae bacterium]